VSQPQPTGGGTRGTIMLDQFVADKQAEEVQAAQAIATATETEEEPERRTVVATVSDQPAILSQQETARQRARLQYVCQLIRRARFPLCSANGVMVLLPFELLQATQRETQQLQKTVRSDVACLQRELAVRCPVTALIVGMHQERGFRELVRRVGRGAILATLGEIADVFRECLTPRDDIVGHVQDILELAVPCDQMLRFVEHRHAVAHILERDAQFLLALADFVQQPPEFKYAS
jgi:hypothetical protein